MLIATAVASLIGYHLTIISGRYASKLISRIDQRKMNLTVIVFLIVMVPISTGFCGVVILVISLVVGFIPVTNNMGKTVLCGCLILPSLM